MCNHYNYILYVDYGLTVVDNKQMYCLQCRTNSLKVWAAGFNSMMNGEWTRLRMMFKFQGQDQQMYAVTFVILYIKMYKCP